MAIKFGDLIENINADQAVIDLLSNNAKGLLFVGDISDVTAGGSGVQAIPVEKRGLYTIVLDSATGNLFAFIGASFPAETQAGTAVTDGFWDDTTSVNSNWVQIGQVPIRQTALFANISSGPEPLQAGASTDDIINKINDIIANPPQTFGRFKAGDLVVAVGDDRNALDIIIDALSAEQPYDLSIDSVTASGGIQFGQTSGSINLDASVTAVNFNLLNQGGTGDPIVPTFFKWYYREVGQSSTFEAVNEMEWQAITSDNFPDNTTSFNFPTITHNWTPSDFSAGQFDFQGFEYRVELRDNSDGSGNISTSVTPGADSFVEGSPVVAIATGTTIGVNAYVQPTFLVSVGQDSSDQEVSMENYTQDTLRSKGNLATRLAFSVTPSLLNADGAQDTQLAVTDLRLKISKSFNDGSFSESVMSSNEGTLQTGFSPTQSNQNFQDTFVGVIDFTDSEIQSSNVGSLDAFKFILEYKDNSIANFQTVEIGSPGEAQSSISKTVKLRMPIYAGFTTATTGITGFLSDETSLGVNSQTSIATSAPADLTAAVVQGLTFQFGGWAAGDSSVPSPYNATSFTGGVFPRLDDGVGFHQDADDDNSPNPGGASLGGYQYQTATTSTLGWIHNQNTSLGSVPGTGAPGTRFVVAYPNDSWTWGLPLLGEFVPQVSFTIPITVNGITQDYRVTVSNGISAHDSTSGGKKLAIVNAT